MNVVTAYNILTAYLVLAGIASLLFIVRGAMRESSCPHSSRPHDHCIGCGACLPPASDEHGCDL